MMLIMTIFSIFGCYDFKKWGFSLVVLKSQGEVRKNFPRKGGAKDIALYIETDYSGFIIAQ